MRKVAAAFYANNERHSNRDVLKINLPLNLCAAAGALQIEAKVFVIVSTALLQAWVGHPYFDVINNSSDFEQKVNRMITAVCNR